MPINEIKDFIFEPLKIIINELDFLKKAVVIQWNAWNIFLLLVQRTLSIICKKEKQKTSKTIRNNYLSTKAFENWKIANIKSVITEYPKLSHKLSKTIVPAEK